MRENGSRERLLRKEGPGVYAWRGSLSGRPRVRRAVPTVRILAGKICRILKRSKGMGFVPLQKEWYDMVIPESRWEEPAMKALVAFACSEEFRRELSRIGTYDFSESGKIFRV